MLFWHILFFIFVKQGSSAVSETNLGRLPAYLSEELSSVPLSDQCKVLLEKFSNSSSKFTRCANQYAKPIFMCRNCVHDFIDVRTYYYALEHSQSEGINCKDLLTSQDKVEIIKATYDYIVGEEGLWRKGYCSSCYTKPLNHTTKLTDNAVTFFAYFKTVKNCFEAHPDTNTTQTEKSVACTACANDYYALTKFYKENFLHDQVPYVEGICFDILDAINSTQHRWGTGQFHCGRQLKGNLPLILAIVVVLLTPVAFYLLTRYGPGAHRAQERVLTQRHMHNILSEASITEDANDTTRTVDTAGHVMWDDIEEEPAPGPSS